MANKDKEQEVEKNIVQEEATTKVKKVRRGISNDTKATAILKFHEKDAAVNGLFVGHLKSVTVDFRTLKDDNKGLEQFAGLAIPRLVFHFASNHAINEQRNVFQTFLPIQSNVDTIPNGKEEWKFNNMMSWLKQILNTFVFKGRDMTEEEEDLLSLNFVDFDENGEFVSLDAEVILEGYRFLFENVASMLNGCVNLADGEVAKPKYKDATGKPITCWLKLLRYIKSKNEWRSVAPNGELAFSTFLNEGFIEIMKANNPPTILRLDNSKESIIPQQVKKAPNIGAPAIPGMAGGVPMGNAPMGGGFNENAGAFAAAAEDLPF